MQSLTALQRLTALAFTKCEYSTAQEPPALPLTAMAAQLPQSAGPISLCRLADAGESSDEQTSV